MSIKTSDAWERCEEKFSHEVLEHIMASEETMVDLLLYMQDQPKPETLEGYIDGWLMTEQGRRFELAVVEQLYSQLPDGPEFEHD